MTIVWLIVAGGVFAAVSFVAWAISQRLGKDQDPSKSAERLTIEAEINTHSNSPFV